MQIKYSDAKIYMNRTNERENNKKELRTANKNKTI